MSVQQQTLQGIIENGQIKPLEPIGLADGTAVELTITVPTAGEQARATTGIIARGDSPWRSTLSPTGFTL